MTMIIPHNRPTLGPDELQTSYRVLNSGWVAQGKEVEAFEAELGEFLGLPPSHVVAVSSGSAALYLSLWVLGAEEKTVGVPVYSCSALSNAVTLAGGRCAYLDCAPQSPNLDSASVAKISPDILIAPSLFGIPAELPKQRNYSLIEDLAQALGAKRSGKLIGKSADLGVCSFYATKLITTGGQGGAIFSSNRALIDEIRDYRNFDGRKDRRTRFNFQMTDLQASIGRSQLKQLPNFLQIRESIFQSYKEAGFELLDSTNTMDTPVRYRAVMRCKNPDSLVADLKKQNINTIIPVEKWELLDDKGKYPNATKLTQTTISLPLYPSLSPDELKYIIEIVNQNQTLKSLS